MKNIKLSFVIPVYNEQKRLLKTFKALKNFKAPKDTKLIEVIFVNDGSTDNTANLIKSKITALKKATGADIVLINLPKNKGKGAAVKKGMLASKGAYALFFDADMATPLTEVKKFVPYFLNKTNVIIGTRKNGESTVEVHQPLYREVLGKCFTYLTNISLNTWVTDFTCGFKAFSKNSCKAVFSQSKIERWGYDAEILFITKHLNYDIKEVAVRWRADKDTKVKLIKTIFTTLKELYTIRRNQITKVYNFRVGNKKSKQLLVVSSYPEKDLTHGNKTVGVASYTKNTLLNLKKYFPSVKITVFAETLGKKQVYVEEGIEVKRIWKRGNVFSLLKLLGEVLRAPQKNVILEFEMFMLGDLSKTAVFVALLPLVRLVKNLTIVVHQVVDNTDSFEKNNIKKQVFKVLIPVFYRYLKISADTIVVFEGALKNRLGGGSKIKFIPHAVEKVTVIEKTKALKYLKLNNKYNYFLYFGFISPYKGVLELVQKWDGNGKNKLIIAGGLNPNYKGSKLHIEYFKKVKQIAQKKDILVTGFLEERDIKYYYSASSIVVLPYKTFMSSSGPLSLAFSYNKGVILSNNLKEYFLSSDIKKELNKKGLNKEDILFDFDNCNTFKPKNYSRISSKINKVSKCIADVRSWENVSKKYEKLILF